MGYAFSQDKFLKSERKIWFTKALKFFEELSYGMIKKTCPDAKQQKVKIL